MKKSWWNTFIYYINLPVSHFKFTLLFHCPYFSLSSPSSLSPGNPGRSFRPRSFCEAELLEHSRRRLLRSAAHPPHTPLPVISRFPPGRPVQGTRSCVCPRKVIPAVVPCWARSGPQAGLEQDGCLWPGGVGTHTCNRWVEYVMWW